MPHENRCPAPSTPEEGHHSDGQVSVLLRSPSQARILRRSATPHCKSPPTEGLSPLAQPGPKPQAVAMTRSFESERSTNGTLLMVPAVGEVLQLLRHVAGDLAKLEQSSACPSDGRPLAAAAHAVHLALVELEPLG